MGPDVVGHKVVGHDVTGAISLGQDVSGAQRSGAGRWESLLLVHHKIYRFHDQLS